MSETVDTKIRDEVMEKILSEQSNNYCFDCGSKAPKWASPYLGIVICYECAAKHRSFGTHISFIRSTNLDKWNRKQLKSLEIAGNAYTKEHFNDMGVPMIGNQFDYNSPLIIKYRQELAELVKEKLTEDDYRPAKKKKKEEEDNENNSDEEKKKQEQVEAEKKKKEEEEAALKIEEEKKKQEEEQKPEKFEISQKAKVKNIKVEGKAGKKNKIKKVDFDFDFDSFNDVNFNEFDKKDDEKFENNNNDNDDEDNKKEEEEDKKERKNNTAYDIKISKEEMNRKFKNKKAISSDDYAALENEVGKKDREVSNKIKSFGNQQAISSDDVFGVQHKEEEEEDTETFGSRLKDMAINFTLSAAEKARELKNKTNDLINKVQNKLGGGYTGY